MRCSSFESQLSPYVDGELGPVARARVAKHLTTCEACTAFAHELRSIDALLFTTPEPELAANFSFKVMAEIRSLPRPHARRSRPLAVLGTYVIFAWGAIGAFLLIGGASARAMLVTLASIVRNLATTTSALAAATTRLFGHHTIDVTAAMGALLALDLVVAGLFVGIYALVRGRRTAAIAGPESC